MTTINSVSVKCPKCEDPFTATYSPSICTWLNPSLVQEIYDQGYEIQCPDCDHRIPIVGSILINAPLGMFMLDVGQELESIKGILEDAHLIGEDGKVLSWNEQRGLIRDRKQREEEEKHMYKGTLDSVG